MKNTVPIFWLVKNYRIELVDGDKIKLIVPVNKDENTKKDIELIKEHKAEIIDYLNQAKAEDDRIAQLRKQHNDLITKLEKQTNKKYAESAFQGIIAGVDPETACINARIAYANYCDGKI